MNYLAGQITGGPEDLLAASGHRRAWCFWMSAGKGRRCFILLLFYFLLLWLLFLALSLRGRSLLGWLKDEVLTVRCLRCSCDWQRAHKRERSASGGFVYPSVGGSARMGGFILPTWVTGGRFLCFAHWMSMLSNWLLWHVRTFSSRRREPWCFLKC